MEDTSESLQEIVLLLEQEINKQESSVKKTVGSALPFISIILAVRELDVHHFYGYDGPNMFVPNGLPVEIALLFGWSTIIRTSCKRLTLTPGPMLFESNPIHAGWIRYLLNKSGVASFTRRIIELAKHNLISLGRGEENKIFYELSDNNPNLERFDLFDLGWVRKELIIRLLEKERKEIEAEWPKISKILNKTVRNPKGMFISYDSTPEVDEFFERAARQHIMLLQQHDDFGKDDVFGGIPYGKYVDILETVVAVAMRHSAYCTACYKKNPRTDISTLLSYISDNAVFSEEFLQRFGLSMEQMQQVFECLTLSSDNVEEYTEIMGAAPPPYIRLSKTQTIRSVAGCLYNPFQFLNFELRRRWQRDYSEAVNNREVRFREELFHLFPDERIVKVKREVNITVGKAKTDIDCVLYDTKTGTLGLFQLKWQAPFSNSLKTRRNASSEFYKANKWVERICDYLASASEKQVLNSLQISNNVPVSVGIKDVYIFVIGRYAGHFSAGEPDLRAVWGSWWQMVANIGKIKAVFDDPIKQAAISLSFMSPEERIKRKELPDSVQPPVEIGSYYIVHKPN